MDAMPELNKPERGLRLHNMTDLKNNKFAKWRLNQLSLELAVTNEIAELKNQTANGDLLYSLARAGIDGVAECALDLIFQWEYSYAGLKDALSAYSLRPLKQPKEEYILLFKEVDWKRDRPNNPLRAIILAGSADKSDKELLLNILETLGEDFRDGALFAASSFSDEVFISAVSKIAMSVSEDGAFSTGEMWGFIACYKRWLERDAISMDKLFERLKSIESSDRRLMRASRLLNYVICPHWSRIPFPENAKH
jgi:hypothetical protein